MAASAASVSVDLRTKHASSSTMNSSRKSLIDCNENPDVVTLDMFKAFDSQTIEPVCCTDDKHAVSLLKGMSQLRDQGLFLDVTLVVEGKRIKGHKLVLSALSPYFASLFSINMKEKGQDVIELHDVEVEAMSDLMEFAYTGMIRITKDNVMGLLKVASYLGVKSVEDLCDEFICKNISLANSCHLLMVSDRYSLGKTKENAVSFIRQNFSTMRKEETIFQMDERAFSALLHSPSVPKYFQPSLPEFQLVKEEDLLKTILEYVSYHPHTRQEILPSLLSQVCLSAIPVNVLNCLISNFPVLEECEESKQLLQMVSRWNQPRGDPSPKHWKLSMTHTYNNIDQMAGDSRMTSPVLLKTDDLEWRFLIRKLLHDESEAYLSVFIQYNQCDDLVVNKVECTVSGKVYILGKTTQDFSQKSFFKFKMSESGANGYKQFISWEKLYDEKHGFIKDQALTVGCNLDVSIRAV